ncbi:Beta-xylanase [Mycena venus]|uniref:Beta-xylanase n=1 Tax=Mycena venus TaxID=2733690 RepID=A0A8H7D3X9_9AGAR|nr:Beta-xylanase [Mycena venus]
MIRDLADRVQSNVVGLPVPPDDISCELQFKPLKGGPKVAAVAFFADGPGAGGCGGQGYTGPTGCVTGSVCYKLNTFFSSCYPTASSTVKINTGHIGDAIAALAQRNGQLLRSYNCVSYDQFLTRVKIGNFELPLCKTSWKLIVEPYTEVKCECWTYFDPTVDMILFTYAWDVVNEPLIDNDDEGLRSFVFSDALGISYISVALVVARAADPKAKLYINDNGIESAGPKSNAMLNLVKSLKDAGIPVDGIGIQWYFVTGQLPSLKDLITNFEAFTALGVEIAITELDLRVGLPQPNFSVYPIMMTQTVMAACKAVAGCVGVTLWDFADKYSWIPSKLATFSLLSWFRGFTVTLRTGTCPGQGGVTPRDEVMVDVVQFSSSTEPPKLMYDGIINGFTN